MIKPRLYKGIEYIQLDDLPGPTRDRLRTFVKAETFIKILVNDKVVNNCILYHDYLSLAEQMERAEVAQEGVTLKGGIRNNHSS